MKSNHFIILKKSDKGGGWVKMDKEYYINNILLSGHLSNPIYKSIPSNTDQKAFQNLLKLVNTYSSNLAKKEKEYFLDNALKT